MLLYGREYLKHNCATIEQPEHTAYIYYIRVLQTNFGSYFMMSDGTFV